MENNLTAYFVTIFIGFASIPCNAIAPRPDLGERLNRVYEHTCRCTTQYPRATATFATLSLISLTLFFVGMGTDNNALMKAGEIITPLNLVGLACFAFHKPVQPAEDIRDHNDHVELTPSVSAREAHFSASESTRSNDDNDD